MSREVCDIVIIGGGPGGYVAAIRAAQLGLKVACVEKQYWGGVCLNVGCIPTKALLRSAEVYDLARRGKEFGLIAPEVTFDMAAAQQRKTKVVRKLTLGVAGLLKKNQVRAINGTATLKSPHRVQVILNEGGEEELDARNVIIATGASARSLPGITIDEDRILSSTGALALKEVPKSLAVIGAGAIGVEFTSLFRALGTEVTLLEVLPRILPLEDAEISAELTKLFARQRIDVYTGARVTSVTPGSSEVTLHFTTTTGEDKTITVERLLMSVGRKPNLEGLGLEALGVATERGFINVNEWMQTNVPGIYAVGDVVPTPQLAHVASAEGIVAVETIAGHAHARPIRYDQVPAATYCRPEVASIGLSEEKARERGLAVKVSKFPFAAVGKATILGEMDGFVKIVADEKYGQILGVHIIGPQATDLIAEAAALMRLEGTALELIKTIHAHPTLAEAMLEAAHGIEGAAIHI